MRKKEMKLIITFHTTADAMAMEKACKEQNVPGRIIPVPRAISAGCGLSWCANLDERDQIKAMMEKNGIQEENMHECLVYVYYNITNNRKRADGKPSALFLLL